MNQHQIQEAYYKSFTTKNKMLWVFEKPFNNAPYQKSPSKCTALEDFQSVELEVWQNNSIETFGIKALSKIAKKGANLSDQEMNFIFKWHALHTIRNEKARMKIFPTKEEHEANFKRILESEIYYFQSFNFCEGYSSSNDEFFITSDNPILEVMIKESPIIVLPLLPIKAIILTKNGLKPFHQAMSFPDSVNAMQCANCKKEIYYNSNNLPIASLKENLKKLKLTLQ
jgi:hypothetical protein